MDDRREVSSNGIEEAAMGGRAPGPKDGMAVGMSHTWLQVRKRPDEKHAASRAGSRS